jgi:hypothetical protein
VGEWTDGESIATRDVTTGTSDGTNGDSSGKTARPGANVKDFGDRERNSKRQELYHCLGNVDLAWSIDRLGDCAVGLLDSVTHHSTLADDFWNELNNNASMAVDMARNVKPAPKT